MIVEFLDKQPGDAHWAFQDWRLDNPDGFYLTQKSRDHFVLHHVGCHHVGSPFWDGVKDDSISSAAAKQKICSPDFTELVTWLGSKGFVHNVCRHCIDVKNSSHFQASNSAKRRSDGWIKDLVEWQQDHPGEMWHPDTQGTPSTANGAWSFQEELADNAPLVEGARVVVQVNDFERNPIARQKCIAHHGISCTVCGFNFSDVYGSSAENYIHVHHLKPLASIGKEYVIDPIKDLRPVCANCHAVIHLQQPPYDIDEVRNMLITNTQA